MNRLSQTTSFRYLKRLDEIDYAFLIIIFGFAVLDAYTTFIAIEYYHKDEQNLIPAFFIHNFPFPLNYVGAFFTVFLVNATIYFAMSRLLVILAQGKHGLVMPLRILAGVIVIADVGHSGLMHNLAVLRDLVNSAS